MFRLFNITLADQHPEEQGLKPFDIDKIKSGLKNLADQHPEEQGLKPNGAGEFVPSSALADQHPEEQGLKRNLLTPHVPSMNDLPINIQKNKD